MSAPYVYGVKIGATDSPGPNENQSTFTEATLYPDHPVFNETPTPISRKLGFPLLVWRLNIRTIGTTNPRTAWLMIDPASHLAPIEWQDNVGDVVVVRADREPLSVLALMAFSDYVLEMLSTSDPIYKGMNEEYDSKKYYEPGKLEEYMRNYPKSRNMDVKYP